MKYMLLLYGNEAVGAAMTNEEQQQEMSEYYAYDNRVRAAGIFHAGEALHPVASAKSVRLKEGQQLISDGPFAETREQLGGFYLLECKDIEEAIAEAMKIPAVKQGTVEIRPVVDFSQMS